MGHPAPSCPDPDPDNDDGDVVVDSAKTVGSTLGWMGGTVPSSDADNGAAADEDGKDSVGRCLDWPTPMMSE